MDPGQPGFRAVPAQTLLAPLVGLLSGALVLPILLPSTIPGDTPAESALVRSAVMVLLVAGASTLACVTVLSRLSESPGRALSRQLLLLTAVSAVWLVPLAVLYRMGSLWAILPCSGLLLTLTRLLYACAHSIQGIPRRFLLALAASVLLQVGVVALALEQMIPAAAGLALGLLALQLRQAAEPAASQRPPAPFTLRRAFNALSLAVFLTAACLSRSLIFPAGPASENDGRIPSLISLLFRTSASAGAPARSAGARETREVHPGVILYAGKLAAPPAVAPRPVSMSARRPAGATSSPQTIPFAGVYWFYRPPEDTPPASSPTYFGSPDLQRYLSTSRVPIRMEARQNLGSHIELACCSRVLLAIRNADSYPGSVDIELQVLDASSPGKPFLSLGRAPVTSSQSRWWRNQVEPVPETLAYTLPPARTLARFDEFRVVFHLQALRNRRSPKIAIDHFTLVPAGL